MSDIRDGKNYTIRKLADGNCWMTTNLAYELEANKDYLGSKNDKTTFTFNTREVCGGGNTNANCIMNGNTQTPAMDNNYYYSWYAATGGKGQGAEVGEDINGSICPSHWKLPNAYFYNPTTSHTLLLYQYGVPIGSISAPSISSYSLFTTLLNYPLNYKSDGCIGNGVITNQSKTSSYWTSTAYNTTRAGAMAMDGRGTYNIWSNTSEIMAGGFSIRCVVI